MRVNGPKLLQGMRKNRSLGDLGSVDRLVNSRYHFDMEIHEISEEFSSAFVDLMVELMKDDPATAQRFFPQKIGWTKKQYEKFLKDARAEKQDWRPKAGKTSVSRYLMTNPQGALLAYGQMQFPLDDAAEKDIGNLVCVVAPRLRHQGFGSYCLALMLFEAVRAGLRRVLVVAASDDLYARKMIENNRGVELDELKNSEGSLVTRYWISF